MLIKMNQEDKQEVLDFIGTDIYQNPYLYIDALTIGIEGENIHTWKVVSNEKTIGIVYEYHNSIQLFFVKNAPISEELLHFLQEKKFPMLTGRADSIQQYAEFLPMYDASFGEILIKEEATENVYNHVQHAGSEHMQEIAALICSDDGIGAHYQVNKLAEQLRNRLLYDNCRNVIICEENKIVSHIATYAESSKIAVLAGLITAPAYRGKGYGKEVLEELSNEIIRNNKTALLYCYYPKTIAWYKKQGWKLITSCGKLEYNQK